MSSPWDRTRSAAAIAAVVLAAAPLASPSTMSARADDPLPVIVTYEMQHQQEAARAGRLDPKAFWTGQILSRIEAKRPAHPKKLIDVATVQVVFTVARDGHLVRSAINKSSGLPDVDQVAARMIARAEPFPPMPGQLADSDSTFVLPVRFR